MGTNVARHQLSLRLVLGRAWRRGRERLRAWLEPPRRVLAALLSPFVHLIQVRRKAPVGGGCQRVCCLLTHLRVPGRAAPTVRQGGAQEPARQQGRPAAASRRLPPEPAWCRLLAHPPQMLLWLAVSDSEREAASRHQQQQGEEQEESQAGPPEAAAASSRWSMDNGGTAAATAWAGPLASSGGLSAAAASGGELRRRHGQERGWDGAVAAEASDVLFGY